MPAVAAFGHQGVQGRPIGQIAQGVPAALAPRVLEIEQLAAVLTLEQRHDPVSLNEAWRKVTILPRLSSQRTKRKARTPSRKEHAGILHSAEILSWHS